MPKLPQEDRIWTGVMIPRPTRRKLREAAEDRRTSMQAIALEAITVYLEKLEKEKAA